MVYTNKHLRHKQSFLYRHLLQSALLGVLSCIQSVVLASDPLLPDSKLTPGSTTNVPINILVQHGYTKIVRSVKENEKRQVFLRYFGTIPDRIGDYEVDHLISLELGGDNSVSNLWPQSYLSVPYNAHTKDKLENYLARRVREEFRTNGPSAAENLLTGFQREIATNWVACYTNHLGKP